MRLSTSLILVAAMLTSAFHMATVSAVPRNSIELSQHPISFSSHHSLVRRAQLEEEYLKGLATLKNLDEQKVMEAYKWFGGMSPEKYSFLKDLNNKDDRNVKAEVKDLFPVWDKVLAAGKEAHEEGWKFRWYASGQMGWTKE
ncbi:hypothetical protein BC835DRAFT_1523503 [Cytidiella melzeri]|nr:hypothetical protein BC835DRAFT_1523503 [Cytidiella melzeri]